MWRRVSARKRDSASPGKVAARTTTALSALASRSTAVLARSLSVQTWAAVNATNKPKILPNGGSIPGEIALNALALREGRDKRADSCRQQVREAENDQRHPNGLADCAASRACLGANRRIKPRTTICREKQSTLQSLDSIDTKCSVFVANLRGFFVG